MKLWRIMLGNNVLQSTAYVYAIVCQLNDTRSFEPMVYAVTTTIEYFMPPDIYVVIFFYVLLDDAKPKSGKCPPLPKDGGVCIASCSIDKDCAFDQKCCSNGCGHTCKQPFYGMIWC